MNMVNFIKSIRDYLLTKSDRVYFQRAPDTAPFPYVVFDLPTSNDTRPSQDFYLEIDGWDNNQDTNALENLIDSIDGDGDNLNPTGLNNKTLSTVDVTATFHRQNRGNIPDEDKRINRRQLRYSVRVY